MSQSIAANTSYAKNEEMINRIVLSILQKYPNINTYYVNSLVDAVDTTVRVYTESVELGENIDEDSIINFVSECIYDIFPYDYHWKSHDFEEEDYDEEE